MTQPQNFPAKLADNMPANADTKSLPIQIEGEHIWKWAQMLGTCPFYQKLGAGGVAAIILTARELKLPPMACLNGLLYNLDGKIAMSGQLMNTMIINAGHEAKIIHLDEKKCTIRFKRNHQAVSEAPVYTFTIDDAAKASLLKKDNWTKYPRDMLFNRCISAGARKFMPDVIGPYYTPEEMGVEIQLAASEIMKEDVKEAECEDVTKSNISSETEKDSTQNNQKQDQNDATSSQIPENCEKKSPEVVKITADQQRLILEALAQTDDEFKKTFYHKLSHEYKLSGLQDMETARFGSAMIWIQNNIKRIRIEKEQVKQ